MRKENDELLCQRYPEIFIERHLPVTKSCMGRGFECGDGWFNIIDAFCARVKWDVDQGYMPPVVVRQVKEKFGTLRIYYTGGNELTAGLKEMAEAISECTCEACGYPAQQSNDSRWVMTLCQACQPTKAR